MSRPHSHRILFVCMQMSPHAVRWINALADRGWDLHVFPCNALGVLPTLQGVTVHRPLPRINRAELAPILRSPPWTWRKRLASLEATAHPGSIRGDVLYPVPLPHRLEAALGRATVSLGESDARAPLLYGPRVLANLVRKIKPDLVHSMEFQHNGYRVTRAKELYGQGFPAWLATNWGSDIYHFRHDPGHLVDLKRLLSQIDYYSCECHRDVALARELGMTARVLPVMPNSGGFDLDSVERQRTLVPPSQRRSIMVKGYQHFAGRALTALEALARCSDVVRNFDVVVFSPSAEPIAKAQELRAAGILPSVTILPYASHDQILRMHSLARVYLGVSVSDAISTSALEAMAMGAFPIQTNTSCCDEWFADGEGGFLIPPDDVEIIADRLRRALTDDRLVDEAAAVNGATIRSRLDNRNIQKRIWSFYDEVFEDIYENMRTVI